MEQTVSCPPAVSSGHRALRSLHSRLHDPIRADAVARRLETLDRELFLEEFAAAYKDLRENHPGAWEEELAECRAWDGTLADGLQNEEA